MVTAPSSASVVLTTVGSGQSVAGQSTKMVTEPSSASVDPNNLQLSATGLNNGGTSQNTSQNNPVNVVLCLSSQSLVQFIQSMDIVVVIVSLPLNVMAITIFLFKMKVRKPAVVYMLNLAAANVLFVILLLFNIVDLFSGNIWFIGDGMCHFCTAAFYCKMFCSVLLLTGMSVDKFLAVVYPTQYTSWRTIRRAWLLCLFIWIIAIIINVPLLRREQTKYIPILNITTCYDVMAFKEFLSFFIYYFSTFTLVFFLLPLIITIVCYTRTILRLSSTEMESAYERPQAVSLTVIVLFVFVLCFGPTNLLFLINFIFFYTESDNTLYTAYIVCTSISSISCFIDPLIFLCASSHGQKYISKLLCCKTPDRTYNTRTPDKAPSTTTPDKAPSTTTPDKAPCTTTPDKAPSTTTPDKAPSTTTPDKAPRTTTPDKSPSTTTPDKVPSTTTSDDEFWTRL
ncbi:proteinase-activated receptor 1-like [Mixophyes fleayi]|uniref:proteinase-activated receptor 1-like n=1 Tax=Mixophyes fleayi TaxID=3061075 RepID=UPI003F4D9DC8